MTHKLLGLMFMSLILMSCTPNTASEMATVEPDTTTDAGGVTDTTGLPNPASVYCEEQGYLVEMRKGEGGVYGACLFSDGSECEEWAYFHGECLPGDSLVLADGWQVYQSQCLGYSFDYPADAVIEAGNDPLQAVTILGSLANDEYWPSIYISHLRDREEYRPPEGADLVQWLADHYLLTTEEQQPAAEVRQADEQIAGVTAVHTRFARSPQSYAYDKYFFAHADQLYVIVILHTGDREEWELYNHFLESFQFEQ